MEGGESTESKVYLALNSADFTDLSSITCKPTPVNGVFQSVDIHVDGTTDASGCLGVTVSNLGSTGK